MHLAIWTGELWECGCGWTTRYDLFAENHATVDEDILSFAVSVEKEEDGPSNE